NRAPVSSLCAARRASIFNKQPLARRDGCWATKLRSLWMSFRSKFIIVVFSATLAIYSVIGGWMLTRAQQQNDPGAQLRIFESVLQHIRDDYVDEPDLNKVRAGALRGLAYGLDPYSTYLTVDQVRDYRANVDKSAVGIGAELSQ